MFRKSTFVVVLVAGTLASSMLVRADDMLPVLQASGVSGSVMVQRGGDGDFEPLEAGMTYAYGSRFRTAAESSVTLAMSPESTVLVLADTEIAFVESSRNRMIKTVRLVSGEVEASLGPNFREDGAIFNVETANSIAQAVGTRFRVASRYVEDVQVVVVRVLAGIVRVLGENFEIAQLEANEWVSLLSPPDETFLRMKNERGQFDVKVKDDADGERELPTEEGSVMKIWQRTLPDTGERVVTAVFNDPAGKLVETVSVTFAPNEYAEFVTAARSEMGDDLPWEQFEPSQAGQPGSGDDDERRHRERERQGEPQDNPLPPDEFLSELVDQTIQDIPGRGVLPYLPPTAQFPVPPRPPFTPTPTPVGNQ